MEANAITHDNKATSQECNVELQQRVLIARGEHCCRYWARPMMCHLYQGLELLQRTLGSKTYGILQGEFGIPISRKREIKKFVEMSGIPTSQL
jgi:hypothetical protein